MKRLTLSLAAFAALGFATVTAFAQSGYHGYRGYQDPYGYRPSGSYHAPVPHRGTPSFEASVRRIMATHSRYRIRTHPRSLYNSAPHRYDYWGW